MYQQVTTWHQNDPTLFLLFLLVLAVVHFIPSFVAFSRKHSSRMLILILNIVMGWTVIGWALLLYWAAKGKTDGLLG